MAAILTLIQEYHQNSRSPEAAGKILEQMTPLLKSQARRVHCMEYEDVFQELCLELLNSLNYLNPHYPEGKCLSYMKACVQNQADRLCRKQLSQPSSEDLEEHTLTLCSPPSFDDTALDFQKYLLSFPRGSKEQRLLICFFYLDYSDQELARELGVSRQYANRLKKRLLRGFLESQGLQNL